MVMFYKSKTLWVNVIAIAAIILGDVAGVEIGIEGEAAILAVINIILRVVTKEPIEWKAEEPVA